MSDLKRTPLYDIHTALGGQMAPFANWDMPIRYSGILDEARAVRTNAGLFDVSHMGRVDINGPDAQALLNSLYSSSIPNLKVGRGRYGVLCNESGGIIDDCILYRFGIDRFRLVPNASNTSVVLNWINRWKTGKVEIYDSTTETAMIAHQGPRSQSMLQRLTSFDLSTLKSFNFIECDVAGVSGIIARTGYTGEDGFEVIVDATDGSKIWQTLTSNGMTPCGLGSRDVLRLEAGLALHGSDIDLTTSPLEAGLDRFVQLEKEFASAPVLRKQRDDGINRKLIGLTVKGRNIPRHNYPIIHNNSEVGHVTSGSYSPTLDTNIAMGYVSTGLTEPNEPLHVNIRGRLVEASITQLPFYSRKRTS